MSGLRIVLSVLFIYLFVLQVQVALKNIDAWEFDIIDMEAVSKSRWERFGHRNVVCVCGCSDVWT